MKKYKTVKNKKITNCIACPLLGLNKCGKDKPIRVGSGAMYTGRYPDKRCLLKDNKK